MSGGTWTAEREEALAALWGEGRSASYIAERLGGGLTRNAVMGKVDRLRLHRYNAARSDEADGTRMRAPEMPPSSPDAPEMVEAVPAQPGGAPAADRGGEVLPVARAFPLAAPAAAHPPSAPAREPVTIHALGPLSCRWPVGDPAKPGFGYCGVKAPQGRPYCDAHARLAYEPPRERRRA